MSALDATTGSLRESWTSNREARPQLGFFPSDHSRACWQHALPGQGKLEQAEAQREQKPTKRWLKKSKGCPGRGRSRRRVAIAIISWECSALISSDRLVWNRDVTMELLVVEVDDTVIQVPCLLRQP